MVQRPSLATRLLDHIEGDTIATAELDPATRQTLVQSPDAAIRTRATKLLPMPGADRAQVVRRYEAALRLDGDPKSGWKRFEENCLKCHQMRGQGHRVGPDLSSVAGKPKDDLLSSILDPNREVAPDQVSFVAQLRDGRVVDGLLAGETATAIRLRRAEGIEESLPRDQIEALRPTGRSLMPDGLEQTLSVQDIADLIAWLRVQGE
jgi:putative heme-binding domain-containing protein